MTVTAGSGTAHLLLFTLDEPLYALPLAAVERVVRAVDVTPLPQAPEIVLGAINAQGRVIPVVDLRRRFRLPPRGMLLDDRFIIARTARRLVALAADDVTGVRECLPRELVSAAAALPFAGYLMGVAKLEDGIVLITDLDAFLSLDEELLLDKALAGDTV
ncbi:MAG: chemotaxis protein CheW [Candidatus Methylomirabilia bacterium]